MNAQINAGSRDWLIVHDWAVARLHEYRIRNDSMNLDDRATVLLRGRIAELKALIDLPKALARPTPDMNHDADAPGEEQ